jgi:hypothetical protein
MQEAEADTLAGAGVIDWPRPDESWKTAIEEAWEQFDRQTDGQQQTAGSDRADGQEEAVDRWLAPRSADLPVWLAERVCSVLVEATRSNVGPARANPLAFADRIMALDHAREVLALLIDWTRQDQ